MKKEPTREELKKENRFLKEEILSPFSRKLSSRYLHLTPKEIQIAHFIKEGRASKEIAGILNVSTSAVDIDRYRLKNKLGLNHQKPNL